MQVHIDFNIDDRLVTFIRSRAFVRALVIAVDVMVLTAAAAVSAAPSLTSFSPGTGIKAAEVNANFAALAAGSWEAPTAAARTFNGGNVGIGTSTPAQMLDIRKDQNANTMIRISNANSGAGSNAATSVHFSDGTNTLMSVGFNRNFSGSGAAFLYTSGGGFDLNGQMWLNTASGAVGIGTSSPASRLDLGGGCMTGTMCSDRSLKTNIRALPRDGSALTRVMGLRGASFEWKGHPGRRSIGLIAQEVEQVAPEVVSTSPTDGQKGLSCTGIDALLVEAIRTQQEIIHAQERRLSTLERRLGGRR